jgi:hypothetical protein
MAIKPLDRRTFLRGALGAAAATVALPPLELMLNSNGAAFADGAALPKRFGVFFWGNGVVNSRWNPSGTGAGSAWSLSEELAPLSSVKSHLTVVSGARVRTSNMRGHHSGAAGILSGANIVPQDPGDANYASTYSAPTIDQVIAERIGGGTSFRSLEVGVDERVSTVEGTTLRYLSHNGPDSVNPQEYNPSAVFGRLFGEGFVEPGETQVVDPKLRLRRSVLDAVKSDADALRKRLGASDKLRLEEHLDGINDLQIRIEQLEQAAPATGLACEQPGDPGFAPTTDAAGQRARSRAMADLIVMATACDITRVWSNLFNGSVSGTYYWSVDSQMSFHQLTHDEPGNQPKVHGCVMFVMEELAYLLEKLNSTPEGDGSLLDNMVILGTSDVSSGKEHSLNDYPILIAGKGGGALKGDYHHRIFNQNASHSLLSICHAMDVPLPSFGGNGGYVESPLSEILT